MKIKFMNLIYTMYMYCNFRVFINISKYLLKSVTFLATTIFIVIHTNMQEILFNPRVRLHSYLQAQFIQPTIERDGDNYSMSRSIQTNTFIQKKKKHRALVTNHSICACSFCYGCECFWRYWSGVTFNHSHLIIYTT